MYILTKKNGNLGNLAYFQMFYTHLSGFLSQKWVPKRWEPKGTQGSFRHVLPRNAI